MCKKTIDISKDNAFGLITILKFDARVSEYLSAKKVMFSEFQHRITLGEFLINFVKDEFSISAGQIAFSFIAVHPFFDEETNTIELSDKPEIISRRKKVELLYDKTGDPTDVHSVFIINSENKIILKIIIENYEVKE